MFHTHHHNAPKLPNKFEFSFQNFHKFKFLDRLRILFRCHNVLIDNSVRVDKRTYHVESASRFMVTALQTEQDVIAQYKKQFGGKTQ